MGNFALKPLTKWSVDDYHRMVEAGILHGRRVELLSGEIVEMSPKIPIHHTTAKRGAKYLEELLSGKAVVRFNGPITLSDSEPEPDIAIVKPPELAYNDPHPAPQAIFWIVEVANTSLNKDLQIKAAIYAAATIQEYWVLDLSTKQVLVFRNPQADKYVEEYAIAQADVLIVIAGMEGVLASVVAGLADCPVVAVPTSIGYGASFNGLAPLLTMLNSCAAGIGVVNIDNGFGVAILAGQILRTAQKLKISDPEPK